MKKGKLTRNTQNLFSAILIILITFTVFVSCENVFINSILPSRVQTNSVKYESSDASGTTYILVITGKTSRAAYKGAEGDSYVLTVKQTGQPNKESKGTVETISAEGELGLKPSKSDEKFVVNVSDGKMTAINGTITLDDGTTVPAPGAVTPVDGTFTRVADMAAWLKAQPVNTAATPYYIKLNVNSLGGEYGDPKSAGYALTANNTKYVSLDLSGSTVDNIEVAAFSECTSLTSVTIGNDVLKIYSNAFSYCTNLTSVNMGNKVEYINDHAFKNCTGLTSIIIPNSVKSIDGAGAFNGCTNLTIVTLGSGLPNDINFNPSAFHGDLKAKYVAGGAGTYTTIAPVSDSSVWTKR